jgi:hypothetical protein
VVLADHGRLRVYGVASALELCEADNEVLRIKEELQLLPREMRVHMQYYQELISRQQRLISTLQAAPQGAEVGQQLGALLKVAMLANVLWHAVCCK